MTKGKKADSAIPMYNQRTCSYHGAGGFARTRITLCWDRQEVI